MCYQFEFINTIIEIYKGNTTTAIFRTITLSGKDGQKLLNEKNNLNKYIYHIITNIKHYNISWRF